MFDAGSGGEKSEPTKVKPMSESQPVAATISEIEAAFPKAKSEFIVKCLKQSMPMASVAQAAVEEMMAENAALSAQCKAMEEELAKYKGMSSEEQPASEMTVEVEEEEVMPSAKRRGVAPVAIARKPAGVSAKAQWDAAIAHESAQCPPQLEPLQFSRQLETQADWASPHPPDAGLAAISAADGSQP